MDTKAAFEKWFTPKFESMMRNGLGITAIKRRRELYREAWTASRAEIEIELDGDVCHSDEYFCDGYRIATEVAEKAITSHGIRIKGKKE